MIKQNNVKNNLSSRAYQHIKTKILSGKLAHRSVISEESLAKEIGISRTPVREAIRRLSIEGILQQIPRYGTIIKELSLKDIIEINELREALEPYLIVKSIQNLTESETLLLNEMCEEINGFIEKLKESGSKFLDESDTRRFLAVDLAFHMILIKAANNQRIMDILINARSLVSLFGSMNEIDIAKLEDAYHRHLEIYNAVKEKDVMAAKAAMEKHLAASKQPAMEQYSKLVSYRTSQDNINNSISLKDIIKECGMDDLISESA
ncbi:MAG TPA: GntR family transcriptional regulator [Phycisphaerales bacterium]|nr:GntR family transcriptional regulator [Phycisphaerales bacterium]